MLKAEGWIENPFSELLELLEQEAPGKVFRKIAREVIPPLERKLDRMVLHEPPPPDRPIDWTSKRQMRYVMAKLSRQAKARGTPNDLRYRRTHQLVKQWELEIQQDQATLFIHAVNNAPMAQYVYGPRQQRFLHKWPEIDEVEQEIGDELIDGLESVWNSTIALFIPAGS